MLGRAILDHVLGDLGQPVWVSGRFEGKILALGSILDRVQTGDVIWGTGSIDGTAISGRQATFLAVRGPLTRDAIEGDVPEIYGDPAMILPDIYSPESIEQAGVGVVPHYVDRKIMYVSDSMVRMIDVFDPWKTVVDQIVNCDVVISSSLHGIIVAETYGVPAVWVVASDRVVGAGFKFRDYYRATGRVVEKPEPWRRSLGSMVSAAEPPPRIKTSEFRAAGAGLVDLQ